MKTIKTIMLFIGFFSITYISSPFAQNTDQALVKFFWNNELGGESKLISSRIGVEGEISMKTFEIEVPNDGEYYLSA